MFTYRSGIVKEPIAVVDKSLLEEWLHRLRVARWLVALREHRMLWTSYRRDEQ